MTAIIENASVRAIGASVICEGDLGLPPTIRAGWSCSPTAAAAAGTARGTVSSPGCSSSAGLATLLIDLLTPDEEARRQRGRRTCASTSACSPDGWSATSTGSRAGPRPATLPIGSSAPAPAAAPRWWRPQRARRCRGRRVARRPARPGGRGSAARVRADAAHRRRPRHAGHRDEPGGDGADARARGARNRARRDAPVRGAGHARQVARLAGDWFVRYLTRKERDAGLSPPLCRGCERWRGWGDHPLERRDSRPWRRRRPSSSAARAIAGRRRHCWWPPWRTASC